MVSHGNERYFNKSELVERYAEHPSGGPASSSGREQRPSQVGRSRGHRYGRCGSGGASRAPAERDRHPLRARCRADGTGASAFFARDNGLIGVRRRNLYSALLLAALMTVSGSSAGPKRGDPAFDIYARPGDMVEISPGRRLNLRCSGEGPITVLLESGLGYPSYSWRLVQPEVARFARVCSYDRAGLGFSDPGPMPRRASAIADDLEALVDKAGVRPPLLLVGSSLGSQSVRIFAFRQPEQVHALLLVDPYAEGQYPALAKVDPSIMHENAQVLAAERRCIDLLRTGRLSARAAERLGCIASPDPSFSRHLATVIRKQRMTSAGYEAAFSESEQLETGSEEDVRREYRKLNEVPVIVLSAGRNFSGGRYSPASIAQLNRVQLALHGRLAAVSAAGCVKPVPEAGHVIHVDAPAVVIAEIRRLVAGAPTCPGRKTAN